MNVYWAIFLACFGLALGMERGFRWLLEELDKRAAFRHQELMSKLVRVDHNSSLLFSSLEKAGVLPDPSKSLDDTLARLGGKGES